MHVDTVQLLNFKSFEDSGQLKLGRVTVLVGPNNAGKSAVLQALYAMQQGLSLDTSYVRVGADTASIELRLVDVPEKHPLYAGTTGRTPLSILLNQNGVHLRKGDADKKQGAEQLAQIDPEHHVVPHLSRRKVPNYQEDVRQEYGVTVSPNFHFLAAKLARIGTPGFPGHDEYRAACEAILGFVVVAVPSTNGQKPGVVVDQHRSIGIEAMGEGVPNIVGLLTDLTLSDGKLFLIEELENDLHPKALKALLGLIATSSIKNQFVVSTHSSLVVRHLASLDESVLYYVDAQPGQIPPLSEIRRVGPDPAERREVLADLGYELRDFDLWDGWLILEESSAERIVRDYLVPWFAPELRRVRTLAAGGNSHVEPTFHDFHRLVRFMHLEQAYQSRTWVVIDGDQQGQAIINNLKKTFGPTWDASQFRTFDQPAFEMYYPEPFSGEAQVVLAMPNGKEKRNAKLELLERVRAWADSELDEARAAFETSAAPVIELLREIESRIMQ